MTHFRLECLAKTRLLDLVCYYQIGCWLLHTNKQADKNINTLCITFVHTLIAQDWQWSLRAEPEEPCCAVALAVVRVSETWQGHTQWSGDVFSSSSGNTRFSALSGVAGWSNDTSSKSLGRLGRPEVNYFLYKILPLYKILVEFIHLWMFLM